jgi:hypothetical protein
MRRLARNYTPRALDILITSSLPKIRRKTDRPDDRHRHDHRAGLGKAKPATVEAGAAEPAKPCEYSRHAIDDIRERFDLVEETSGMLLETCRRALDPTSSGVPAAAMSGA